MSFPALLSQNSIFKKNHLNLEDSYNQFLSELREDISDGEESPFLSPEFQEELSEVIFQEELNSYHPLKFYWLNLIDKIIDTLSLKEEDIEESNELVGVFSESDLLGFVIHLIEQEYDAQTILDQVIEYQELQIISFFHLHISEKTWQPNGPVSYPLTPEIGEANGMLILGEEKDCYFLPWFKEDTVIPIIGHFPSEKKIQVMVDDDVKTISSIEPKPILKAHDLLILSGVRKDGETEDIHFTKAERALKTLKDLTPELFENLTKYTQVIVPIYEKELVSYSMAILPSYSSINMNNRDFVDMTDDLIHENGHHFLNSILEGEEEIIFEDDDKIFYSPWRRSLRPIRGLYHGVATFYWAYRLFKELSFHESVSQSFTEEEIEKIHFRFLEESLLLTRCDAEIKKAFKLKKISSLGMEIYNLIISEIKSDKDKEKLVYSKVSTVTRERLDALEKELNSKQ